MMTRNPALFVFTLALMALTAPAQAQNCYGGFSSAEGWTCACDAAGESALETLVMSGHSRVTRQPDLARCQAWAAEQEAVSAAPTPEPPAATADEAAAAPPPEPRVRQGPPPDTATCLSDYDACRGEGQDRAACVARFNSCEAIRTGQARQRAVEAGIISSETAAAWGTREPAALAE